MELLLHLKKLIIFLPSAVGLAIGIVFGGTLSSAQNSAGTVTVHQITSGPFIQHSAVTKGFYGAQAFSKLSPDQKLNALNEKLELLLLLSPEARRALNDM
jgi:hypothetical protein